MRAGVYCRVSTNDGSQDTDNQRIQLRQFCADQQWEVVEYVDHDSGGKSERTAFQALLRDAAMRRFDIVVFWALDRFSREGTLATLRHLERLESYGVRWRSFTEPWIDSAGPFRDVIIALLATMARQERVRLGERVKAGLDRARARGTRSGKAVGRPRKVFRRDQVAELRHQGLSWRQIARRLGVGEGTVRRVLQAPSGASVACQNPSAEEL